MSDISPLTRIELLLDKITTWQRLGPRVALLAKEIESVRRDREHLGSDALYFRRHPDPSPGEAKDVEDCTAALRAITQHGDAVTAYAEGAGIPSGPLALFVRTLDFSLIPGALEVLCRARAKVSARADDPPFIPNELQERILAALDQKALTLDALVIKLKVDRKTLCTYGLNELKAHGLVHNNQRVGGYYRPDAPPPKYAKALSNKPS